jgi:vacuolar-type H+-ATPase subunit E/Vma4
VYNKISEVLQTKKKKVLKTLDERMVSIKEELKKEADKKKDNQYDFKQKEKELKEHLETMT